MKAICSFILALAVSSAGAQIRPVESLPIAVNYSKTIHLVFPSAVKYNQAVTDFVAVDNPESVKLSEGGITETSVDIRILMREAVLSGATIMAFVHNHPSGNTQPSKADDVLTQQIAKACQVMRLFFMDHVIVTDGAFYSYHDKGRL